MAGAAFGDILGDSRSTKCCIFQYKIVSKMGRVRSPKRRVRDDDFIFGLSSDYPRIILGSPFYWRKSHCQSIWYFHLYLVVSKLGVGFLRNQFFSIFGTDFIVLFWPDVSCHSASAKGLVIFIEYCQLSDAKSKVQQFHVIYLLFWCCQLSVAIIAKGSFSFVLVIFIVMNTASCQMPKVKCNNFI